MSFNINIAKLGQTYMDNTTHNFNNALTQYNMRKSIGLELIYGINSNTVIENNVTTLYNFNVSGGCIFNNLNINNMYISNNLIAKNNISINSNFYIQNNAIVNNISILNTLFINNTSIINNNVTVNNNLFMSNYAMINIISANSILVDSDSIFNNVTCKSNLNVLLDLSCKNLIANNSIISNNSILNNVVSLSDLYTNNFITNSITTSSLLICKNLLTSTNSTIISSLYVSNVTNIIGNINISSVCSISNNLYVSNSIKSNKVNISGTVICMLPEYLDNATAAANGIPYKGLYRLGGLVKVRLDLISPIVLLNGDAIINTYINNVFRDPLITISDNLSEILNPIIVGNVNTTILGTYNLSYYAIDSYNNKSNIVYRTVNVINYPIISNILIASKIITFTLTGVYNTLSYTITKNNIVIVSEILLSSNSIDTTTLILDLIPYNIILLLKDLNNYIIKTIVIGLTSIKLGPVLEILGFNPYYVKSSPASYDVSINPKAYTIPSTPLGITYSVVDNLNISQAFITGALLGIVYNKSYKVTYSTKDASSITISYTLELLILDTTSPVITLIGNAISYIDKNSVYIDPGYNVSDNSGQYTITVTGYVNVLNLGTYFIKYTAIDIFNNKREVIRTVTVREPILILNQPIIAYVDVYSIWIDPGYKLQSTFDTTFSLTGDTSINTFNMSTYIQIYTATDMYSSTSVTRTVTVRRSVLKLIFPEWHEYRIDWLNTMYTQVNKPFVDPGYIITDSSVLLSIVGNVNTSIPGAYKLVYTTIDSSSVTSIVSRYVIVTDTGFISFSPLQNDPSDPSYIYSNNGGSAIIFDNSARATNGATAQNAFAFGFRGYGITKSYDPTFDYNGTWSIMIKFRSVLFSLFNFDFDNYYNSAGNAPGGIPLHTIYFKGISNGAEIGGPEYTTVYYTTFPMIVSYVAIGVYIVLNRISNYNIFKIYNLAGVLLCDVTSKVPFAYTKKQQIFSITNINATEPRYFTSFGAGIYYKKTELFPSDWNPVILVGTYVDGNRPLYYSLL